jgi:hypothetical protein
MAFTSSGTDINVWMFMHPLVFSFMLFWLGLVGYNGWQEWNSGSSVSFLLGFFAFGLALSLGGFFAEVMKVKAALSDALMNPPIRTGTPQPADGFRV